MYVCPSIWLPHTLSLSLSHSFTLTCTYTLAQSLRFIDVRAYWFQPNQEGIVCGVNKEQRSAPESHQYVCSTLVCRKQNIYSYNSCNFSMHDTSLAIWNLMLAKSAQSVLWITGQGKLTHGQLGKGFHVTQKLTRPKHYTFFCQTKLLQQLILKPTFHSMRAYQY